MNCHVATTVAGIIFCLSGVDVRAQWFCDSGPVVPDCGGVFVVETIVPVPVVRPWLLSPLPFRAAPVEVVTASPRPFLAPAVGNVGPAVPPMAGGGNVAAAGNQFAENFVRKNGMPQQDLLAGKVDEPAPHVRGGDFSDAGEIRRRAAVLKASTPVGRMRADRLISSGDQAFAQQNLARATALYRDAIAKAPDYAEAHFRLAHAYIATRRYNLALKSVLVALELSGTSRRDGFSLEDMYQGDLFPREQHFNRLLDASRREPADGGLKFLIGFTLHFNGDRDKAVTYFRQAQDLDGIQQSYARYFLPVTPVGEPIEAAK